MNGFRPPGQQNPLLYAKEDFLFSDPAGNHYCITGMGENGE